MEEIEIANLTPRMRHILEKADQLASQHGMPVRDGKSVIGAEHVFLAILQDEDGVPVQAIRENADISKMIEDVLRLITSASYLNSMADGSSRRTAGEE